MESFIVMLVLFAALLHAGWNALVKSASDPLMMQAGVALTGTAFALVLTPFLPVPPATAWPWLVASVIVHQVYFLALAYAYEHGDLSKVYPIARGSAPLMIALGAAPLLGEDLAFATAFGIALVSFGILSLAWEARTRHPASGKSTLLAFVTGISIAAYSLADAAGVRTAAGAAELGAFGYIAWLFVCAGVPFGLFVLYLRRGHIRTHLARLGGRCIGGGLVALAAYGLVLWAYSLGAVAPVSALRETSVVFAALLGTLVLREPFGARRVVAAGFVAAGIVALNLGG